MAEWGKSDPVATWGASDPVSGTARDQGRAKSEQVWKRKLGSLQTRNAKGQTFNDFWAGYSSKAYDAAGKPAPGAPGGPTRAQAGVRRDMAARDERQAAAERARLAKGPSPIERMGLALPRSTTSTTEGAALDRDRSSALVQGYSFGLGDEIMGLRSAAKTGKFIGPARAAGSVTRAAGVGGAMGAAYGAGSAEPGSRMKGAAVSGGVGAVTGGLAQVAGNALAGRVATAPMRPVSPQRQISRQGTDLTPGQMIGGSAQRIEDAFTSVPFSGDAIRDAQRRGIQSFDRAAMDRVLAPIGGAGDDIGRAGMRDTSHTSAGNRAYAQGDALLQDLAEPAMQVLPQTVPDSGTALRSAFTSSPQGLIVGAVTGIPTALIYSRPVQYVLNAIYRASDGVQAEAGLQQLAQLAARNPALAPLYIELQGRLGAPVGAPGTAAQTQAPPTTQ
jgi:hypothetical protein